MKSNDECMRRKEGNQRKKLEGKRINRYERNIICKVD